jgi:hypothetical protein
MLENPYERLTQGYLNERMADYHTHPAAGCQAARRGERGPEKSPRRESRALILGETTLGHRFLQSVFTLFACRFGISFFHLS